MSTQNTKDTQQAGTGFMLSPREAIQNFEKAGYVENIVPKYDHLELRSGAVKLFPEDFVVDDIVRFENTSDPADQAILYAISARKQNVKGIYMESFGLGQDDHSPELLERLKQHLH